MKMKRAGITDEVVVEYSWADHLVSWSLVSATALKRQDAKYTLTPDGDNTRVKFELTVDPKMPLPGFVMRRATRAR